MEPGETKPASETPDGGRLAVARCFLRYADGGLIVFFFGLMWLLPNLVGFLVGVLLVLPFFSLYFYALSKPEKSRDPSGKDRKDIFSYPFTMPGLFLSLLAALRWTVIDYGNFGRLFFALVAALLLLNLPVFPKARKVAKQFFLLLLSCVAYSYGAIIGLNIAGDRSVPEVRRTTILGKTSSHSRGSTQYYLWLDATDLDCDPQMPVSKARYLAAKEGDLVFLSVHKGLLGMRWASL